jgi:hypothetical protein
MAWSLNSDLSRERNTATVRIMTGWIKQRACASKSEAGKLESLLPRILCWLIRYLRSTLLSDELTLNICINTRIFVSFTVQLISTRIFVWKHMRSSCNFLKHINIPLLLFVCYGEKDYNDVRILIPWTHYSPAVLWMKLITLISQYNVDIVILLRLFFFLLWSVLAFLDSIFS